MNFDIGHEYPLFSPFQMDFNSKLCSGEYKQCFPIYIRNELAELKIFMKNCWPNTMYSAYRCALWQRLRLYSLPVAGYLSYGWGLCTISFVKVQEMSIIIQLKTNIINVLDLDLD